MRELFSSFFYIPKISKGKIAKHSLLLALQESYSVAKKFKWGIMVLYLSGAGTNNARLGGMLRQLAMYYHKDANNLFMVRLAQVRFDRRKGIDVDLNVGISTLHCKIYIKTC